MLKKFGIVKGGGKKRTRAQQVDGMLQVSQGTAELIRDALEEGQALPLVLGTVLATAATNALANGVDLEALWEGVLSYLADGLPDNGLTELGEDETQADDFVPTKRELN
jgi:hypothetical protein